MSTQQIALSILGRSYTYTVSDEEDAARLQDAAGVINEKAAQLQQADRTLTAERLAVNVALQIVFDASSGNLASTPAADREKEKKRLVLLTDRCEAALA